MNCWKGSDLFGGAEAQASGRRGVEITAQHEEKKTAD